MKPLVSTMTEFDTLPSDLGEADFGIADPRLIMKTLADLYSNRELAVIREYSTNARDAHIMAGKADVPIRITLPTNIDPNFRVIDSGVGMSRETLLKRYTQFGDSDKTESTDTNGMMGYGCKSAIAYTTQFTVTSVFEGYKTIAVVTRRPDYSVKMKVVAYSQTTEPNGTVIEISVSDIAKFNHIAGDFYKYWHPGTVLVNGIEPEQAVGEQIADNLYYSKIHGTSYVVMANVAYRIANPDYLFRQKRINPISFVAYVDHLSDDLGPAIEHTPSREDLKYTDRTNQTLNTVIGGFIDKMLEKAKNDLSKATTHYEAYRIYKDWGDTLGGGVLDDLTYKGDKFQNSFPIKGYRYNYGDSSGYGTRRIENWNMSDMNNALIITGFTANLASSHKAKVRQWCKIDGNPHASRFLFTDADTVDCKWLNPKRVVDWEVLKAAIPKKQRDPNSYVSGPRRPKGTFDYWTSTGHHAEKPLPTDGDLFFIRVQDSKRTDELNALKILGWDKASVIVLAANRIDKFKKDNPTVKDFLVEAKKKVVLDGPSLISAEAKKILSLTYKSQQWLNYVPADRVVDPEWKRIRELHKKKDDLTKAYDQNESLAICLGMRYDVKKHNIASDNHELIRKYPILDHLSTYNGGVMDDVIIYLNAAYKAKKGN